MTNVLPQSEFPEPVDSVARFEAIQAIVTGEPVDPSSRAASLLIHAAGHALEPSTTSPQLFAITTEYRRLFDRFFEKTGALWGSHGALNVQCGYGSDGMTAPDIAGMADARVFSLETLQRAVWADEAGHGLSGVFIPPEGRAALVERMRKHPIEGQARNVAVTIPRSSFGDDILWGKESSPLEWEVVLMAMIPKVPPNPLIVGGTLDRAIQWRNHFRDRFGLGILNGARSYLAASMQALVQGAFLDGDGPDVTVLNPNFVEQENSLSAGYFRGNGVILHGPCPLGPNFPPLRGRVLAKSDKRLLFNRVGKGAGEWYVSFR